ncbi:MAG: hypothetical protein AAGA93_20300 [Actinomycetota bacterium]
MEATLTLSQAGRQLGVDDDALSRLILMGALPEARRAGDGDESDWVIPERSLPVVAARNGWTIDLRGARALVTLEPSSVVPVDGSTATPDAPAPPRLPTPSQPSSRPAPRPQTSPVARPAGDDAPSVAEVVDLALLDRLLGAQEQRVLAETRAQETTNALSALNHNHNRLTSELEIERHERLVTADRYREERLARAAADAKVTELRNRVTREMALAENERQAKSEAVDRSTRAERDAANAFAAMGWLARRRYRRLTASGQD